VFPLGRVFASLLGIVLATSLALGLVPTAHADGGAPNLAYVSGTADGVAVIDIAGKQVTGTIHIDGDPRGMTLSADSRFLYVAQAAKDEVAVVDALSKQVVNTLPVGQGPTALILDLIDPGHLWVANTGSDTVTVLNPDSGQKLATISVGLHPSGITIAGPSSGINETDGSSEVLVANQDGGSVSVIGSESFKVITTVALPDGEHPFWVMAPNMGGIAYITTEQGHIYGLTLTTHQIFGPIFNGGQFHYMDYDAITGQIYVPDSQKNIVDVLHPVSSDLKTWTREPLRTLSIGGAPWGMAVTNDGSLGLVGQHDSGDVTMLDVPGHNPIGSVHVGGQPQFLLAGPYPPLVNRQSAQIILIVIYVLAGVILVGGVGWLVWWMRKQERRIRQLHALEDQEFERQLLALQAIEDVKAQSLTTQSRPPARAGPAGQANKKADGQDGAGQNRRTRQNGAARAGPSPGSKKKTKKPEPGGKRPNR
jgi:YVTN family beta-propeller protein